MKYEKPVAATLASAIDGIQSSVLNKLSSMFVDNLQDQVPPTNTATSAAYEADE